MKLSKSFAFAILGLIGLALVYCTFGSERDTTRQSIDGLWSGKDTNGLFGNETMFVKLTTNGYGVFLYADHKIAIPGTFTYRIVNEQVAFVTNNSPALKGTLRYIASSDVLIYQERVDVAAALRRTSGPVMLLRDTNQLHDVMLGSMAGATNYHDALTRLGQYFNTLTNNVK